MQYLQSTVGDALSAAVAQALVSRAADPVSAVGEFLVARGEPTAAAITFEPRRDIGALRSLPSVYGHTIDRRKELMALGAAIDDLERELGVLKHSEQPMQRAQRVALECAAQVLALADELAELAARGDASECVLNVCRLVAVMLGREPVTTWDDVRAHFAKPSAVSTLMNGYDVGSHRMPSRLVAAYTAVKLIENVHEALEHEPKVVAVLHQWSSTLIELRVLLNENQVAAQRARYREAFDAFDADKSGSIDIVELRRLFATLHIMVDEDELQHIMTSYDSNHDQSIDFDEFCQLPVLATLMRKAAETSTE